MQHNKNHYAIIMAGGIGSRFWPVSKTSRPKQFIDILGIGSTLIQQTYKRLLHSCPAENIYVVTNEIYTQMVKQQLPDLKDEQILGEPAARNTAPCIALASYKIHQKNPNAVTIVAPSDHLILNEQNFTNSIQSAFEIVEKEDKLLTLGIIPTRPDTGYGYIQYTQNDANPVFHKVKTFTEKPDLELAKTFVASGDFVWNAGIFIWSTKSIIAALQKYMKDTADLFEEGLHHFYAPSEHDFVKSVYSRCPNISIDYGIMEKASNVYVKPADFEWSDLGTWGSLYSISEKDYLGNVVLGTKNAFVYDAQNCMVSVPEDKVIILQGLEDYIVAEYDNTLLICKKSEEQSIKQISNDVKLKMGERFI
jgi:mannose-1-phosphate guanylyltransferase